MTYVVTENCIRCKYTDCVEVCPVDCFHEGENFLVIDPEECIDCTLCAAECPVGAIFGEDELPPEYAGYKALNAELAKTWPLISAAKAPLPRHRCRTPGSGRTGRASASTWCFERRPSRGNPSVHQATGTV